MSAMRAAVYLRQSLDASGEMLAIARQRPPCLDLCAERGWEPVEYVDNNVSATRGRRPAYEQMLADIEAGSIQAIVVWDLDRLYRRPVELEHLIELADRHRLALATVTGDVDLSTDGGRLFARIKGAVAKAEMERKSARQKLMHTQRAEAGIPWGDRRIFGFTADRQPHPVEAAEVREGCTMLLAGGSLGSIAARWNAAGLTTTLGNAWNGPGVSQFLRNPALAGLRAHLGEIVGPATWPPIVEPEVWQAVAALLSRPNRNVRPGDRGRKYLLTGIAECGMCDAGRKMGSGKTSAGVTNYRCPACYGSRDQRALDMYVEKVIAARLSRDDAADLLVDKNRVDLPELRAESARLQGRLDALAEEFAEGELTSSQLRVATKNLKEKLAKITARMADSDRVRILDGVVNADDPASAFAAESLHRRRAIITALVRVVVGPTRRGARFDPSAIHISWLDG